MSTAIQMNAAATKVRSFYSRVTALGFRLITLSGIVALITSIAAGETGEGFVFSLVFIVVGLLVAGAVWSFGGWALILAALLSLALLGLVGPFALFALAHPESAIEFVPVLPMLAGAFLGLIGSIVALLQSRRRTARTDATGTERLVLGTLLGAVALASLFSMAVTLTSRTTVSAEVKAGDGRDANRAVIEMPPAAARPCGSRGHGNCYSLLKDSLQAVLTRQWIPC